MTPLLVPELITFDLDGVLADSSPCHARAYDELWDSLGIEGPPYASIAGRPTVQVVEEVTRSCRESHEKLSAWTTFKQERARHYLEESCILFDDTAPVVNALASRFLLALATGASRSTTLWLLERLGLRGAFPVIVASEDVKAGKPNPEPFTSAMSRSGVLPGRTLVVEDSEAGLAGAIASGAFAVTVRTGVSVAHDRFLGAFEDLRVLKDHFHWALT